MVIIPIKGRTQCTRLPLYAGSGRGECRLALPPFYGEAAPKSQTRDLLLMGEGTCHRTKCDLYGKSKEEAMTEYIVKVKQLQQQEVAST
ncbi:hypothetical protein DVH24_018180 [Malus domestica]|uniref:ACB domain-containing protein n=1 Tax=Malus domestica TaxID=3750 RepID=A0A498KEU5_MALDO|nr:hypothetical protein DVH24_018180 [Malus domestica]